MRIHLRGICLLGVLFSEVSCLLCHVPPVEPTLSTLVPGATRPEIVAAKVGDDVVVVYHQKVYELQGGCIHM